MNEPVAPAMPALDPASVAPRSGSGYPAPYRDAVAQREKRALGDVLGLSHFGVNLVRLPPGKWSSQRHWHTLEDEFVMMLEGEVVVVEDDGDHLLRAGECVGWKAGVANGHCLQNRSDRVAVYLEVGSRRGAKDGCDYPDIDMVARAGDPYYTHRDGTPYPK
jgi:uncharacterized cupin superfamily protein